MTGGRDIKNTRQLLNTFFQQNVEPFQKSSIILSGGVDRPYYYSLGNQSTVPFVRLQGSGGTQKEFTWGETVEVLPGQNVQVESASYMPGDIQIQSGRDVQNRPARTTISIKTIPDVEDLSAIPLPGDGSLPEVRPVFPCDCRGAKRAYLGCRISTGPILGQEITFSAYGFNRQHSWTGRVTLDDSEESGWVPSGKKYISSYAL